jgi:gamma-glutamyltranspeptidase / glutathione hydrolase
MVSPVTMSACVFFIVLIPMFGQGQGRNYGRSMVITQQGIAATSQTLASQAGAQILAKGGSAVDAAIAVLAVVEPATPEPILH